MAPRSLEGLFPIDDELCILWFLGPLALLSNCSQHIVDFWCGKNIAKHRENKRTQKRWLWVSLATNLGILGFFKYYDFFVSEFVLAANWLGWGLNPEDYLLNLLLPISFYTFQTMAYSIDIFIGVISPNLKQTFARFALYVAFFPQLVAGPVERARTFVAAIFLSLFD